MNTRLLFLITTALVSSAVLAGCAQPEEAEDPVDPGMDPAQPTEPTEPTEPTVDPAETQLVMIDGAVFACVDEHQAAAQQEPGQDQPQVGQDQQTGVGQDQQQPDTNATGQQECGEYRHAPHRDEQQVEAGREYTSTDGRVDIDGQWYECADDMAPGQPMGQDQQQVGEDQQQVGEDQQQVGQQDAQSVECQTWRLAQDGAAQDGAMQDGAMDDGMATDGVAQG